MGKERSQIEGYIFAVVSSVSFSAKGIFAKIIYAYGVEPVTLLALRFAIAAPFFWLLVLVFPSGRTRTRDVAILVFSGFIGIYAAALCDFYGLLYLDAINREDYPHAYSLLSTSLKAELSLEDFTNHVRQNPQIFKTTDSTFSNRNIENDVCTLRGTVTSTEGGKTPVRITLVKEGGQWRIRAFRWGEAAANEGE